MEIKKHNQKLDKLKVPLKGLVKPRTEKLTNEFNQKKPNSRKK